MLRSILRTDLMGNKRLMKLLNVDYETLLLIVTTSYYDIFFRTMLIEIKNSDEDGGRKAAFALEDLEVGKVIWRQDGLDPKGRPKPEFNKLFGPWDGRPADTERLLIFSGEMEDLCCDLLEPEDEDKLLTMADVPPFPPVDYKLFSDLHRQLKEYENRKTVNSEISFEEDSVLLKATEDPKRLGSEVKS